MPAILQSTANDILNRTAVEVGLDTSSDPFSDTDRNFIQMRYLLNIAGEELIQNYPWESLVKSHSFTTDGSDEYNLPTDFLYMINQTGWESTQGNALAGPLSSQDWTYLESQSLGSTVYPSFRINEGVMKILNDSASNALTISYEYMSRNWVLDSTTGTTYIAQCQTGADTPMLDRTLLSRYLKVKWLESKNLDSSKAQADLNAIFSLLTARNKGASILSASGAGRGYAYLNGNNAPDTGYG